jgi:tetratricopeptide (TPR) repeat protein
LQKWARRHPRLTSSGSVGLIAAVLLLAAGAGLVAVRAHLIATQEELAQTEARERKQVFETHTQEALCLVNTVSDTRDHLQRGQAACEKALHLYGVLERDDWQDNPAWRRIPPEERAALAEDVRELLLLLAHAHTRLAPKDGPALRHALDLLTRARTIQGLPPSRALWEDRASYHELLGEQDQASAARTRANDLKPASARDHYLLATSWVRNGKPGEQAQVYARAIAELTRAIELNPRHYWSHLQRGICYRERGEYLLAAGDYATCIGLGLNFAWAHCNYGDVLERQGKKREAVQAYSAALRCDPDFAPAYVNRGTARLALQHYAEALADFDAAIGLGHDDAAVHAGRGCALEGLARGADADQAFRTAFAGGPDATSPAGQRLRWAYGFAVARRLPERAAAAFQEVLQHDPEQPQALYGRAMLVVDQHGRWEEAIGLFERALEADPAFVEARRAHAVLLARCGKFHAAMQQINRCLERDRQDGATLYAAACVAARLAEKETGPAGPEAAAAALRFLQEALEAGYGQRQAHDDPDLRALQSLPEFRRLLELPR